MRRSPIRTAWVVLASTTALTLGACGATPHHPAVAPSSPRSGSASAPVSRDAGPDRLEDWSSGGSVALVSRPLAHGTAVRRIDVRTGRIVTVDVPRRVDNAVLVPDGTGFVAGVSDGARGTEVDAVTWHGQVHRWAAVGGESLHWSTRSPAPAVSPCPRTARAATASSTSGTWSAAGTSRWPGPAA